SDDWLPGENAMRNSGKAIIRAPWFLASLISCLASSRLAAFSVEEVICARAMRVMLIGPAKTIGFRMLGFGSTLLHYVARYLTSGPRPSSSPALTRGPLVPHPPRLDPRCSYKM